MLNRILEKFTRLIVVWVLVTVAVGFVWPGLISRLKTYTDWLFALTMFGIGAVLSLEDFIPIFRKPQNVVLGTLAQFVIMPALAFMIALILKLPPALALGLILAGAVPDAMAAGVMTYLASADVALSVSLTTLTTLISPIATPALTYLFGRVFIPVNFWPIFLSILKMVIAPLCAGLLVRHYFSRYIEKIKPVFPAMSTLFIAFICGLVTALNRDYIAKMSAMIFLAVVLLNLFGLILGYGAGKLFGFEKKQCRTLSIGVGMQNAGLGAVLALKHFSAESAISNALFAVWCIVTAAILALFWRQKE